jgi:3-polyprenyl-4-hydroxybenzoate decarboxylase
MKRIIVALTGASGAIPAFYALPATLDGVVNQTAVRSRRQQRTSHE